ncbi:MAG TPA: hypothetical protein VLA76_07160 [Candidatus Angelobacter sp.]|nr:hypothetical protein [Candidatus Angelobacter sp.]
MVEMLEIAGWNVGMSAFAAILLVAGAVLLGAIPQFIGEPRLAVEWIFPMAGVLVGGWIGSEALGALSTWGPVFEGLYVLPAIVGGVVLGATVDVIVRYVTGGTYVHEPRPI